MINHFTYMTYERFSQLWKALVTDRPRRDNLLPANDSCLPSEGSPFIGIPCSRHTEDALIAYGKGEPSAFDQFDHPINRAYTRTD